MKYSLFLFVLLLGFSACNKNKGLSVEEQAQVDKEIILKYISDNNLDAEEGEEGLFYVVNAPGTGDPCNGSSTVKTTYNGYFVDGNSFDGGTIDNFPLQSAIVGWQIGIPKYREGGDGILLIPSAIGYGPSGSSSGSIPPNTVIIFDIDLIKVY